MLPDIGRQCEFHVGELEVSFFGGLGKGEHSPVFEIERRFFELEIAATGPECGKCFPIDRPSKVPLTDPDRTS
jgi:hypothetical protein